MGGRKAGKKVWDTLMKIVRLYVWLRVCVEEKKRGELARTRD